MDMQDIALKVSFVPPLNNHFVLSIIQLLISRKIINESICLELRISKMVWHPLNLLVGIMLYNNETISMVSKST